MHPRLPDRQDMVTKVPMKVKNAAAWSRSPIRLQKRQAEEHPRAKERSQRLSAAVYKNGRKRMCFHYPRVVVHCKA